MKPAFDTVLAAVFWIIFVIILAFGALLLLTAATFNVRLK